MSRQANEMEVKFADQSIVLRGSIKVLDHRTGQHVVRARDYLVGLIQRKYNNDWSYFCANFRTRGDDEEVVRKSPRDYVQEKLARGEKVNTPEENRILNEQRELKRQEEKAQRDADREARNKARYQDKKAAKAAPAPVAEDEGDPKETLKIYLDSTLTSFRTASQAAELLQEKALTKTITTPEEEQLIALQQKISHYLNVLKNRFKIDNPNEFLKTYQLV